MAGTAAGREGAPVSSPAPVAACGGAAVAGAAVVASPEPSPWPTAPSAVVPAGGIVASAVAGWSGPGEAPPPSPDISDGTMSSGGGGLALRRSTSAGSSAELLWAAMAAPATTASAASSPCCCCPCAAAAMGGCGAAGRVFGQAHARLRRRLTGGQAVPACARAGWSAVRMIDSGRFRVCTLGRQEHPRPTAGAHANFGCMPHGKASSVANPRGQVSGFTYGCQRTMRRRLLHSSVRPPCIWRQGELLL